MASTDTFEWFTGTQLAGKSPEIEAYIREQRAYLFSLRSEDERQRFVESVIRELKRMLGAGGRPGRKQAG